MDARLSMLNDWQHGFPLNARPFATIAEVLRTSEDQVIATYAQALADGSVSRIGGVFAHGAGGDAVLAAMAVPPERLEAVAAQVSAHPGVNHNYAREHRINLWFVLTGASRAQVEISLRHLETRTGLPALCLRMVRPYRIDLGFDLRHAVAHRPMREHGHAAPRPLRPTDWPLASLVEEGLTLTGRPFEAWARRLALTEAGVIDTLSHWLDSGRLKRFGVVVRHHELGFGANAMTVFDVPDDQVDACGQALAAQAGVTLAYRRTRHPAWPYNLYAMVHGRQRDVVRAVIDRVTDAAGLGACPREVLFSTARYKQMGGRRFRNPQVSEVQHAVAG
ncbi:MAG: Lrp/AsnC family transcriptional regulator [Burkholderiaceae bacterium]